LYTNKNLKGFFFGAKEYPYQRNKYWEPSVKMEE